ncbi:MAG: Wzz/FepE/Etk N-terminal domain-containing protein [Prolixibacteraceae bacterium]
MDNFFDNKRILNSIWKWKLHIVIVIFISIVLSAIISGPYFIEPKYKSVTRIYPVNISEASKESESEHLLENLQSTDIKFRVIDAFHLDEVYKISKDEKLYQTYMLAEYDLNISYKKTEFETVEIKVLDPDPKRACVICDSIVVYLNQSIQEQRAVKYREFAEVNKKRLDQKSNEIDSLFEKIEALRKETGLIDYFTQAETATRGLMDAAAYKGDKNPSNEMIGKLVNNGGMLRKYQELLENYEVAADTLKLRYDYNMAMADQKLSYSKVVEHPFVADKKSYPIRWLIVFLAAVAATIVSFITVSLIDYIREAKSTL